MIGHSILAIQKKDGSFLCDNVSSYFLVDVYISKEINPNNNKKEAKRLYNSFGKNSKEYIRSLQELDKIYLSRTCREEDKNKEKYHPESCDGIIIIPLTKDCFLTFKEFKEKYETKKNETTAC